MPPGSSDSPISRSLLLSLYLPSLLLSICNGLLIPTLPVFASGLEVSYLLVGFILAGESIGMLMADLPAGFALRHLGRKRAMLLGLGTAAFSVLALAFTEDPLQVLVLRLLAGAGAALFNISRHVYMASELSQRTRGRATALFGGTNRLGHLAGPVLGGYIAGSLGMGATFMVYGGLALFTLVLCWLFVERRGQGAPLRPQPEHGSTRLFMESLRDQGSVLIPAGIGQLCAQAIRMGRQVLIPLYAADVLGLPVESIGLVVGVAAAIDFALFYVAGIIMDRYGRKWAIVPSFLIQALSLFLLPFAADFTSVLLIASLGGLGNGIGSGTMMTLGLDLAPDGRQGEFLGLWRFIGDVGSTTGPLLVGGLAGLLGLSPAAIAVAVIGAGGSLLFARVVPETLKRREVTRA